MTVWFTVGEDLKTKKKNEIEMAERRNGRKAIRTRYIHAFLRSHSCLIDFKTLQWDCMLWVIIGYLATLRTPFKTTLLERSDQLQKIVTLAENVLGVFHDKKQPPPS